ncbi:MAG: cupredoxin domain-containing protein [Actinomycetota bacterium]|nr:cupredoxin domain-containing protein [Actinomycetota bacterium]
MSQDLQEREEVEEEEETGPRLTPLAYPLLALLFGGILVWSVSRVLLAVSTNAAVAVGTLLSLNILIGAALVAYGGRVRGRPAALPLLIGAGIAVVAAGVVSGFIVGERPVGEHAAEGGGHEGGAGGGQAVTLTARNSTFVQRNLEFTANSRVTLRFVNEDRGVPHNFVLFRGEDASAPQIFRGEIVTGPTETTYSFMAPGTGSYFFYCEVHPQTMTGTARVTGGGATEGQGGTTVGAANLTAQNSTFEPRQLTVPAGGQVTIRFTNSDQGLPHNFAVYEDQSATQEIYRGETFPGPATRNETFRAPPPGRYFFRCDVHPTTMTGTLVVT